MQPNVPNFLTCFRLLAIPMVVMLYFLPETVLTMTQKNFYAALLTVVASITDWLDGYLARKWQQTSHFGAFFDPVADKLLVAVILTMLLHLDRISPVIVAIIIGREISISALREWMALVGHSGKVVVNMLGKLKTTAQMVALPLLLWSKPLREIPILEWFTGIPPHWNTQSVGAMLAWLATGLTIWSMGYYFASAWPFLVEKNK